MLGRSSGLIVCCFATSTQSLAQGLVRVSTSCDGPPEKIPAMSPLGYWILGLILLLLGCFILLKRQKPGSLPVLLILSLSVLFGIAHPKHNGVKPDHLKTSKNNVITHTHEEEQLDTKELKADVDKAVEKALPAPADSSRKKSADASTTYDCHGLTFNGAKSFINSGTVETILADDFETVDGAAMVGDVLVYKIDGKIVHSGIVTEVDKDGKVTEVKSKWGAATEFQHKPEDVPREEIKLEADLVELELSPYGTKDGVDTTVFRKKE